MILWFYEFSIELTKKKKGIAAATLQYLMHTYKLDVRDNTFLAIVICWEQTCILMSSYYARTLMNKQPNKAFRLM